MCNPVHTWRTIYYQATSTVLSYDTCTIYWYCPDNCWERRSLLENGKNLKQRHNKNTEIIPSEETEILIIIIEID